MILAYEYQSEIKILLSSTLSSSPTFYSFRIRVGGDNEIYEECIWRGMSSIGIVTYSGLNN